MPGHEITTDWGYDDAGLIPWSVLGRIPVAFGLVELVAYRIARPLRIHAAPADAIVEMLLDGPAPGRTGRFGHLADCCPLGDLVFLPPDHALAIDWSRPYHGRAIRCYYSHAAVDPPRHFTEAEMIAGLSVSNPAMTGALNSLAGELMAPGFGSSLLTQGLSTQVAVELGRYFRGRVTMPAGQLTPAQMALIDRQIDAVTRMPLAEELADLCQVSRRHFFRLFRHTTAVSPAEYVTRRRIERAKQLLRTENAVIKQVAYHCGFQTASGFSAAFRRATGMTPREFHLRSAR